MAVGIPNTAYSVVYDEAKLMEQVARINTFNTGTGFSSGGYVGTNAGYSMYTIRYTNPDTKQTIVAEVMSDGTIHVDPAAFDLIADMLGFEREQ